MDSPRKPGNGWARRSRLPLCIRFTNWSSIIQVAPAEPSWGRLCLIEKKLGGSTPMNKDLLLRYLDVRHAPLDDIPDGALHADLLAGAPSFYRHLPADLS